MRNKKAQGFTLIELLIVIAIIGILAAVLIPNLLGARAAASERAAESHGRNVYTAVTAYLAENIQAVASNITVTDCNSATGFAVPGYSVKPAGSSVTSCTYAPGTGTDFTITVESIGGNTYTFP